MSTFTNWWRTVGVLIGLELRQRTRTTRWRVLLGVFFLVVSLVVFGTLWFALSTSPSDSTSAYSGWADNLYFTVLGFVGFLGLVIAPTMTATSINGDRKDATLAVIQATPTTGLQLALGKLLGAWCASCALLVVCLPYLVWAIVESPYPVLRSILGIVVIALIYLCYCGFGLGFSALFSRPIGSAAVTQLTVLFLLIGLPALTALLTPAVTERVVTIDTHWSYDPVTGRSSCRETTRMQEVIHTERIWWIIAPNPAVIFADAASASDPGRRIYDHTTSEVRPAPGVDLPDKTTLGLIADEAAWLRAGEELAPERRCVTDTPTGYSGDADYYYSNDNSAVGSTWYWGLLANLALGGIGLAFAARRLRVPAGNLPRGVRIA